MEAMDIRPAYVGLSRVRKSNHVQGGPEEGEEIGARLDPPVSLLQNEPSLCLRLFELSLGPGVRRNPGCKRQFWSSAFREFVHSKALSSIGHSNHFPLLTTSFATSWVGQPHILSDSEAHHSFVVTSIISLALGRQRVFLFLSLPNLTPRIPAPLDQSKHPPSICHCRSPQTPP